MIESNPTVHTEEYSIAIDEPISAEHLSVLEGTMKKIPIRVLKDDGLNSDIAPSRHVRENQQHLKLVRRKREAQHFEEGMAETSHEVILNATLQIGSHTYKENWVVSASRYDVLLRML